MRLTTRQANAACAVLISDIIVPIAKGVWRGIRRLKRSVPEEQSDTEVTVLYPSPPNSDEGYVAPEDEVDFIEIFNYSDGTVLGIEKVERIPDETAFVRILTEETMSKQFKKKVYLEGSYKPKRYIVVDGQRIYLQKAKASGVN